MVLRVHREIFINFQDIWWDIKVQSSNAIFKFNIICSMHCDFYRLYEPTDAHKLYEVTNYTGQQIFADVKLLR